MNTFSSTANAQQPAAPASSSTLKWLWGAVGALTLAVLALGGTLIAQQHKAASQEQEQQAEVAARNAGIPKYIRRKNDDPKLAESTCAASS